MGDAHQEVCPRCAGLGHVRGVESLGLAVLRLVEEEATKDSVSQLVIQLPVSVATFMLNEKRAQIDTIEKRHGVRLVLIPNPHLETPHYDIERIKDGNEKQTSSHQLITTPEIEATVVLKEKPVMEQPAVTGIAPIAPAPIIKPAAAAERKPSLLKRLLGVLTGAPVEEPEVNKPASVVKETDVEKVPTDVIITVPVGRKMLPAKRGKITKHLKHPPKLLQQMRNLQQRLREMKKHAILMPNVHVGVDVVVADVVRVMQHRLEQ